MLIILLTVVFFVAVTVAAFSLGAAAYAPTSQLAARLKSLGVEKASAPPRPSIRERLDQWLEPLTNAVPLSRNDVSQTHTWLVQAGYRERRHLLLYFASRVFGAVFLFLAAIIATGFESPLILGGAAFLGFFLPRFALKRLIRQRQRKITVGLPDALDLTVVCVEAGLPLDGALVRVGEDLKYAHPELSEELHLANLEMRAGKPRPEALRNLAARTGVDDIRSLAAALIQTDRFGTSIAQALRVYSDALRTERRRRAEELAAKTSIKMIIPLVVFALLPLLLVTLGPALIELFHDLHPSVRR
jgi:tight adherence protein C